jgi:hypothetical protein
MRDPPSPRTPTPDETFNTLVRELVDALKQAFAKDIPTFSGLVLLYASMDIISSLSRPIDQDTTRSVFKNWVNTYMLRDAGLGCNADDIYAARCGILHTLSLSSLASREGKAKQISYLNKGDGVKRLQEWCDAKGRDVVVVSIYTYTHAFYQGIYRFTEAITADATLRAIVFHHLRNVASMISFDFRDANQAEEVAPRPV